MIRNALEYLEGSAGRCPDLDLFFDEYRSFTYASFAAEARRLGDGVREAAGGLGRPVAIIADRSSLSLLAMFAVLYSGNFYAPIDTDLPDYKIDRILANLKPALIISPSKTEDGVAGSRDEAAANADETSLPKGFNDIALSLTDLSNASGSPCRGLPPLTNADPAYVLHTSGSTGEPKGVLVTHGTLIDFTEDYVPAIGISEGDVIGNQPPFSFDGSIRGVYPAVKAGASAYMHSKTEFTYLARLMDVIEEKRISVLSWSTSALHLVAGSGVFDEIPFPQTVRKVIAGGEALRAKHLNAWRRALPGAEYYNVYGPSEVIDCTYYKVDRDFGDFDTVPIGTPYPNKGILLLKDAEGGGVQREAAPGECGEICVRGSGIASGYYGDPARTAEAFVQNPLHDLYRDIVYRTGDTGRMGEDGLLYFIGRSDGQIKHIGYRIELGEIETAASGVDGVDACACLHDGDRDILILVYEGRAERADIVRRLRAKLPKFMLPNSLKRVEIMPRNANGKIDRAALAGEYTEGGSGRTGANEKGIGADRNPIQKEGNR
jgi:amino acid adenylation domain-containing protein